LRGSSISSWILSVTSSKRRIRALTLVFLIVLAGCSSGDDGAASDGSSVSNDEQAPGDVGAIGGMDPGFETDSLPDDFPSTLIPDSFTAGMYAQLGTVRNANFESSASFDDVVSEYTDKIGEPPTIVQVEERLAQWTVDIWIVSIIEGTPTLIGVATSD
jgi:hypothetical protein